MKIDDLERISNHKTLSDYDLLIKGAKGSIRLYSLIKEDIDVYYDLVESRICIDTGEPINLFYDKEESTAYTRGEIKELPIPAIDELILHSKLEGNNLALMFLPPTNDHKLHSTDHIAAIELSNVYFDKSSFTQPLANKSPVNKKPHIRAIIAAIEHLGVTATNADLYSWIKKETNNPTGACQSFFNYLDFDDDGIVTFNAAQEGETVLKYDEKTVTKKNFQSISSREKQSV